MAEATSVFESGINGDVLIGTYELPITSWSFRRPVKVEQFRNSRTAGQTVYSPTYKSASGTVFIDYDSANDPLNGSPATIQEGQFVTNLELVKDNTTTPKKGWVVASALITEVNENVVVDGKIGIQFSFVDSGGYAMISS